MMTEGQEASLRRDLKLKTESAIGKPKGSRSQTEEAVVQRPWGESSPVKVKPAED